MQSTNLNLKNYRSPILFNQTYTIYNKNTYPINVNLNGGGSSFSIITDVIYASNFTFASIFSVGFMSTYKIAAGKNGDVIVSYYTTQSIAKFNILKSYCYSTGLQLTSVGKFAITSAKDSNVKYTTDQISKLLISIKFLNFIYLLNETFEYLIKLLIGNDITYYCTGSP